MIDTTELCQGLGISRSRLDQWISRGFLKPERPPVPGGPRMWDLADTMRAAITKNLFNQGIKLSAWGSAEKETVLASRLANLHGLHNSQAVLALFADFAGGPIRKRILPASEVPSLLCQETTSFLLLINLDKLEAELIAKFPALA
ncbi:MerR family transcriptional regulator [Salipiger marinus]|uniref:MerR family transcriptional regulator n=1 Tax=Salipiger marinus TaxID=555512 RepID=UPI002CA6456C|nr:MerR family transcriptional regulator [Salipiger manganoxidans]MEB3417027.1 MerR family transcriptional regulator [Salipiger manganoxidans]